MQKTHRKKPHLPSSVALFPLSFDARKLIPASTLLEESAYIQLIKVDSEVPEGHPKSAVILIRLFELLCEAVRPERAFV